jgi:hypothetical protein
MAVHSSDGVRHHSASRARMHEEKLKSGKSGDPNVMSMKPPAAKAMPGGAMTHPAPTGTPIEDHVAEHGPAHAMEYHHDKETNMHHVSSFHGEAEPGEDEHPHAHHSEHRSAEAAHRHMGKAMGMHEGEETADEMPPENEEETADAGGGGMGGSKVPGLA